jgi:SAM-dependent methyltransferase
MRRLTLDDTRLIRTAYRWDASRPRWYREMDGVFGLTEDELVKQVTEARNMFMGIFDGELIAIILVVWCGAGRFTAHLLARRHADLGLITIAARQVLHDMLDYELKEASVWVAEKNTGVHNLCANIGLLPDGVVMYKGSYRGRLIKWLRHSVQRDQLLAERAA